MPDADCVIIKPDYERPTAPSVCGATLFRVLIYLTDRKVGLLSSLRRDSLGSLRFRCFRRFLRFSRRTWRFGSALYERFKALRSRSAFACITRQPLKRFFWRFGFLHLAIGFLV